MSHSTLYVSVPICVVCRWPVTNTSTATGEKFLTIAHWACIRPPGGGKR